MSQSLVSNSVLIVTVVAYLSAVAGFWVTFQQLRINSQTNTASFWLSLRSMFDDHEDVHRSLQTDMTWRDVDRDVSDAEAIAIVAYMGMFELVYKMLQRGLLDWDTFQDVFGYRILLIMNSPAIVTATLVENGRWWLIFRQLAAHLGHQVPDRSDYDLDRTTLGFPAGWGPFSP
jgi:hypothetical protein